MSRFNTGNPLGSGSPLDLDDNAKNMDLAVNSDGDTFQDRLGKSRLTWAGMESGFDAGQVSREQRFNDFIVSSGYQFLGDYTDGLEFTEYNQLVRDENGEFWRVSGTTSLPYTATGAGVDEGGALVSVGDAFLRKNLLDNGAEIVTYTDHMGINQTLKSMFDDSHVKKANSAIAKRIKLGFADTNILVQGDSTGNESWEFVRLMCSQIAHLYPNYGVRYIAFNPTTQDWEAESVQAAPVGSKILRVYNGCVSGSSASYWFGSRNAIAFNGIKFDLIICNYGLNHPTSYREQLQTIVEYYLNIRSAQPQAQIMHILQNRDFDIPERNENRVKAQTYVSSQLGIHVIDSYSMFDKLIAASSQMDWYQDGLHPNVAGQEKLAALVTDAVLSVDSYFKSSYYEITPTNIPNGTFDQFDAGGANPMLYWYEAGSPSSVEQVTVVSETGTALKYNGVSSSNTSILALRYSDWVARGYRDAEHVFLAARVFTTGSTYKPGTILFQNTQGVEYRSTRRNDVEAHGGWRWVVACVRAEDFDNSESMLIRVYGGEDGESVIMDRIIISSTPAIPDCRSSQGAYVIKTSDTTFTVAAGATASRVLTTPFSYASAKSRYTVVNKPTTPPGVISEFNMVDGALRARYTNTTEIVATVESGEYVVKLEY